MKNLFKKIGGIFGFIMIFGSELHAAGYIPNGVVHSSITPMTNPKGVAFSFVKETPNDDDVAGYQISFHIKCAGQRIYFDGSTAYYTDGVEKRIPATQDGAVLLKTNPMYPMYLKYCTK